MPSPNFQGERPTTATRASGLGRVRTAVIGAVALATVLLTAGVASAAGEAGGVAFVAARSVTSVGQPDFGPNVKIFDPSMPQSEIQATLDAIANEQVDNEMGTQRYALLFKPGVYGTKADPLVFQVGYYTEVAGLGQSPTDVTINGEVNVYNRCLTTDNCIALDNFWRSLSNLTINPLGESGCRANTEFWAVSQAAPVRRVNITGGTTFMDYCTAGPMYASGGFMADSRVTNSIVSGSQQQFFVRDSSIGGWSNAVWNQVFAGVQGAPAQSFPTPPYTTLATNPASRERPYLYIDGSGNYDVFVPDAQAESAGSTWMNRQTPGHSISLTNFFLAKPSDSVRTINNQLAQGKNLLFTPGVYNVDQSIWVKRADTIVLGLGVATLTAVNGAVPLTVADVKGVDISGLMIDAGTVNSPALLQIGTKHAGNGQARQHNNWSDESDPTGIQDVFFRVGGPHAGKATVALQVNSDNAILDDIWAWRADHGQGVGWTVNTADIGVVVNGDNVTATGLFSEHFQKYNVLWNGENGKTVFFQNEMPYDAPDQAAWQHDGVLGYAAYKVADSVSTHEAWGLGSYIYTNVNPSLHASNAFEVPDTPGVKMHDLLTVSLNSAGTIDHVINGIGAAVTPTYQGPSYVLSYP
jgi:hypothetical protein